MVTLLLSERASSSRSIRDRDGSRSRVSLGACRTLLAASPERAASRRATCSGGRTRCSSSRFLNYLPYSKHLHVLTSLPNIYLSNTSGPGMKGAMRYMDLEAEDVEQFGASDVDASGVEESSRRIFVHRVRPLHRGVSGATSRASC